LSLFAKEQKSDHSFVALLKRVNERSFFLKEQQKELLLFQQERKSKN